ncbi:MAG: GIDE domain-containing protein [Candidatus Aenigmatarchaeota archaeon]
MAEGEILGWIIFGIGFGILSFITGLKTLFLKRMIENIPTSKVRSIAMGLVEIYGQVVPIKLLKSPFSGKDCVYYKYKIEEMRGSGKNRNWTTVKCEEKCEPFYIKDETGAVLVDCTGANVDINYDSRFESRMGKDPPSQVVSFLKAHKLSHEDFLGINKHMRYTEWFIGPGEKIYILGTATDNPNVKLSSKGTENIIIKRGENEKIFYVSDKSEKEILSSLGWKVIVGVFGGAILTVVCLGFLILYLQNM